MAKRSKKKTYAELVKISEDAVIRKNAEYEFDPSMIKQDLKDRIAAEISEDIKDAERSLEADPNGRLLNPFFAAPGTEQTPNHVTNRGIELNFASRALIAGLGAFVNSLGVTVTHGAESADIVTAQAEGWVDVSAICNLIDKNRGEEKSEAYLKRLIDEDNARKNPPKAEEVKPAIRHLDLED